MANDINDILGYTNNKFNTDFEKNVNSYLDPNDYAAVNSKDNTIPDLNTFTPENRAGIDISDAYDANGKFDFDKVENIRPNNAFNIAPKNIPDSKTSFRMGVKQPDLLNVYFNVEIGDKAVSVPVRLCTDRAGSNTPGKAVIEFDGYGVFKNSDVEMQSAYRFDPSHTYIVDASQISSIPKHDEFVLSSKPTPDFFITGASGQTPSRENDTAETYHITLHGKHLQNKLLTRGIVSCNAAGFGFTPQGFDNNFFGQSGSLSDRYNAIQQHRSNLKTGEIDDSDIVIAKMLGCDKICFDPDDSDKIVMVCERDPFTGSRLHFDHFDFSTLVPDTELDFIIRKDGSVITDKGIALNGCRIDDSRQKELIRDRDILPPSSPPAPAPAVAYARSMRLTDEKPGVVVEPTPGIPGAIVEPIPEPPKPIVEPIPEPPGLITSSTSMPKYKTLLKHTDAQSKPQAEESKPSFDGRIY